MGISVSESHAQKQRIQQLSYKKIKANTNSEIRSEQKKPFEEIHGQDHQIQGVTNIRTTGYNRHIVKKKQTDQNKHTQSHERVHLKSIKVQEVKNQQNSHTTHNNTHKKNKSQSIKQFQTIEHDPPTHSKLNNNDAFHKSIRNASPSYEKRVSFVEPQRNSKEKLQDSKQLSKEVSKTNLINRTNIQNKPILNNQASRTDKRGSNQTPKQSPINKTINKPHSPAGKKVQSNDDDIFNVSKQQLEHSRIINKGSKTLTASKNVLRLQNELEDVGKADDMQFQNFDWKIPKSTVNKVVPSHKKLKPQASVVLISKMGKQQDNNQQMPKKSNWKNRRELMNEIVSGRLDSAQVGFSIEQCMPKMKDYDIYKEGCI